MCAELCVNSVLHTVLHTVRPLIAGEPLILKGGEVVGTTGLEFVPPFFPLLLSAMMHLAQTRMATGSNQDRS